ncbi:AAA family ATPase, partial [Pseudooceanicola sp.]|uniref:AAA family ATPase n=1 Tax=Pseudooceanicola sp. TaxID=1914328 RepID=UPI0035172D2B
EIMQEYSVTIDGTSHEVPRPFLVMATQNPLESEGTYNLPEAQLDRFMFLLKVEYPTANEEIEILKLHSQQVDLNQRLNEEVKTVTSPTELLEMIKAMCKRAGIAKLDGGPKGATIQFHNDKFANPQGLVDFIKAQDGLAKVKDNKIVVRRDWNKESDKIKGAFAIARDLAEKVKAAQGRAG